MITFTKEQLIARINQVTAINKYRIGMDPNADGLAMDNELFAIALASLEAEPVAYMYKDRLHADARFSLHTRFGNWSQEDINEYEITEIPLYTATPAPVFPRDLEEIIFTIVNAMADEKLRNDESELFSLAKKYIEHAKSKLGAAMLQGAEPVTTANKLPDGYTLVPVEPTYQMCEAMGLPWESPRFPDRYKAMIAAAPHFREISNSSTKHFRENSETSTKCWCHTCRPVTNSDMRFVVCPDCGNKRCPHANDHRNACTGSNEPGQEGSAYPATPQQEISHALAKGMERYGDAMQELAKKEGK